MKREILKPLKNINNIIPEIDGIFIITLKDRKDRHENIKTQLNKLNLSEYVYIIKSDTDKDSGNKGCYESHRYACKLSLEYNFKNTLIFEDDFVINGNFIKNLQKKIKKLPKGYYRYMLGCIPIFPLYDFKNRLFYGSNLCTTSYIFSKGYAEWFPTYKDFKITEDKFNDFERLFGKGLDHTLNVWIYDKTWMSYPSIVFVDENTGTKPDHKGSFWEKKGTKFLTYQKSQYALQYVPLICYLLFIVLSLFILTKINKLIIN